VPVATRPTGSLLLADVSGYTASCRASRTPMRRWPAGSDV